MTIEVINCLPLKWWHIISFLTYTQASFSTTFTNPSYPFPFPTPNVPYDQITTSCIQRVLYRKCHLSSFLVCLSLKVSLALHKFPNHQAMNYALLNALTPSIYQSLSYKDLWVSISSTFSHQKKCRNSTFLQLSILLCKRNWIIALKDLTIRFNQGKFKLSL